MSRRISIMKWNQGSPKMEAFGRLIECSCDVRNEVNGWRKKSEVVRTLPDYLPYYPRIFPTGKWKVHLPEPRSSEYLSPFFIPTNAGQKVEVWSLLDGEYHEPTGMYVWDDQYGIHYSTSPTTLGCLRISQEEDLLWLVSEITDAIMAETAVWFEVRS